jgi:diguanylate cyclase (GGDEF)-like protein
MSYACAGSLFQGQAMDTRWLFAAIMGFFCVTAAAEPLVGTPPYVSYSTDLDVYPQNFAIVQDAQGIVYVGNTNGVLEFDGERWALTALDNREIVRSLAVDQDDRVLVGGYNALGYLQRDAQGSAHFVDLTPRFREALGDREFADIWDIVTTPDGIYYRALHDLFFWNPRNDEVLHWHHPGRFGGIRYHQGELLLQFRGQGFKRRHGDAWVRVPGTDHLVNLIHDLLPLGDGSLLMLGLDGDWNSLKEDEVTPATMPEGFPASSNFHATAVLADGSLALASADGLLYIVDPTRRFERHFKIDPGFLSEIFPTRDGGFLVSGYQNIYRVTWPTSWSMLGAEHGADGTLQKLRRWNGSDYLMSSAGALKLVADGGGIPRFEHPTWSEDVYDLIELEDHSALLAGSHKLTRVRNEALTEVSAEMVYPRVFLQSRFRPERVYIGTENGLRFVDMREGLLNLSEALPEATGQGISSLIETSADELWLGSDRHGVWQVSLDARGEVAAYKHFGSDQGLQLGVVPTAFVTGMSDGTIIASTRAGIFRLDGGRFVADDLHGLATLRAPEEFLRIAEAANGDLWAYGIGRLFRRMKDQQWIEQPTRGIRRGALESHHLFEDGRAAFIATQSLLFHDGSSAQTPTQSPRVKLRAVALVHPDGRRELLPLRPENPLRLQYGEYGISFQFALPDLEQPRRRSYQGRLLGYENEFSPWSSSRGYTYTRLSPGQYTLQVRARDGLGQISEIEPYVLIIDPPWYRTWWWYALVSAVALLGLWWSTRRLVNRRTRRLADDKRRLESTVAERTRDLAEANRQLDAMAHLDGLTGIANRRRLDEYLSAVWRDAHRHRTTVAVLAIDVDHFKNFNDTHGHLAGDQLLKDLIPHLAHSLRHDGDLLARYGGEEFLVVLPDADTESAVAIAQSMRQEVERSALGATISIGVACWIANAGEVTELIKAADLALYEAKRAGRNRVAVSDTDQAN